MRAGQVGGQLDQPQGGRGDRSSSRHALVLRYGAAVVVMAFDEQRSGRHARAQSVEICKRSYRNADRTRSAFRPQTSSSTRTSSRSPPASKSTTATGWTFIEATRAIKKPSCPLRHGLRAELSNVSFSFRGNDAVREAIHSVFLYHAIAPGWTWPSSTPASWIYEDLTGGPSRCRRRCRSESPDSAPPSGCSRSRRQFQGERRETGAVADRPGRGAALPVDERLQHALVATASTSTWSADTERGAARSRCGRWMSSKAR